MKVVQHVVSVNIEMSTKTYNSKFYTPNAPNQRRTNLIAKYSKY